MNVRMGQETSKTGTVPGNRAAVSFSRAEWLTLTMLADLLQFKDEQLEIIANAEADGHNPDPKRKADGWLDYKIKDIAKECRWRNLDDQIEMLARQYPAHAHLLAEDAIAPLLKSVTL